MNERCSIHADQSAGVVPGLTTGSPRPQSGQSDGIPGRDSHRCKRNIGHSQLDLPTAPIDEYRDPTTSTECSASASRVSRSDPPVVNMSSTTSTRAPVGKVVPRRNSLPASLSVDRSA